MSHVNTHHHGNIMTHPSTAWTSGKELGITLHCNHGMSALLCMGYTACAHVAQHVHSVRPFSQKNFNKKTLVHVNWVPLNSFPTNYGL